MHRPLDYAPPDAPIDLPDAYGFDDQPSGLFVLIFGAFVGIITGSALTIAIFAARGWMA